VTLPLPPVEMRRLVGPVDEADWDNPDGRLVLGDEYPAERYRSVFDFGCGCGRIARRLVQQDPRPERYLGIDLHKGMVRWCSSHLAPAAPGFEFRHHAVHNPTFNPRARRRTAPFPAEDRAFSLVLAWSVFTHLVQSQIDHYLAEIARVLEPDGVLHSTWFLFERSLFPMLEPGEHGIYSNDRDPTRAAVLDRDWVLDRIRAAGLTLFSATPPALRGFQWVLRMTPSRSGVEEAALPRDEAPVGRAPLN
jgi:SAM-dependent methyltransferase